MPQLGQILTPKNNVFKQSVCLFIRNVR